MKLTTTTTTTNLFITGERGEDLLVIYNALT